MANSRALSAMLSLWSIDSWRATVTQGAKPPAQKRAASVWSAVRSELESDPIVLTSLNSAAYSALASGWGPRELNSDALGIKSGVTCPSHALGSLMSIGGVGRHWPASVPTGN